MMKKVQFSEQESSEGLFNECNVCIILQAAQRMR